jgi:hypothetical protein
VIPFLGLLGYELRYNPKAYEVEGLSFAISLSRQGGGGCTLLCISLDRDSSPRGWRLYGEKYGIIQPCISAVFKS